MLRQMLALAVATCLDRRIRNLNAFGAPEEISKKAWQIIQQAICALKRVKQDGK